MLMAESAKSNRLTLVKSRSIWVITSKQLANKPYWTPWLSQHALVVNPWSKTWSNPASTLTLVNVFWNFCHVLQISPKHLKIYQCESCLVCRGTQLSCRLAFQILIGNWWKTWSTVRNSCSPRHGNIQSLASICAKSFEKNTIRLL
jgi:hypothetical protein